MHCRSISPRWCRHHGRSIANLPYNVASPLLVRWLRQAASFERLTLMFQQEVAERICAEPDTPAYGRLSVLAQWTCDARIVMRLPPAAFTPPPKVWSAVVSLTPHERQPDPAAFARMEALTGGGIRPAPQDVARVAAWAGRRGVASARRDRARTARGDTVGGGVRSAGCGDCGPKRLIGAALRRRRLLSCSFGCGDRI